MESMRCLALGVSDAPPLEFLQGAANGAKAFGAWAKSVGIPAEVITDEEQPIGFDTVKSAFERLFAGRPKISRLLIYFAGHGLARDPAEDLWLLSQWSYHGKGRLDWRAVPQARAIWPGAIDNRFGRLPIACRWRR